MKCFTQEIATVCWLRTPYGRPYDVLAVARKFATGQTVGTWLPVPGSPRGSLHEAGGGRSKCLLRDRPGERQAVRPDYDRSLKTSAPASPSFSPRSSATTRRRRCKLSSFPGAAGDPQANSGPVCIDGVRERLGILIVHLAQHDQTVPRFHAGG